MRALIAEDDKTTALILTRALEQSGLSVTVAHDGNAAWQILAAADPPQIVILDWMMPGIEGLELCRRIRTERSGANVYVILVTSREARADVISGLDAGADDYIVKPFDVDELRARTRVGMRVVSLQLSLARNVAQLQDALARVKQLSGLLPICSYCKRIRKDEDYWQQMEQYLSDHSEAQFSHGICPDCFERVRKDFEG